MEPIDRRELLRRGGLAALAAGAASAWPGVAAAAPAADRRLRELVRSLQGDVLTRSSRGYAAARRLHNPRFDAVRPLAIA